MIQLAHRMEHVHSDIRGELYREAMAMQARGIDVLKLNTGNPAAFGFPLPESIRAALEGNVHKAVAYCDFQGMPEAREAICAYERDRHGFLCDGDDVIVTDGANEALFVALFGVLNPGDEVLVPTPAFVLYERIVKVFSPDIDGCGDSLRLLPVHGAIA